MQIATRKEADYRLIFHKPVWKEFEQLIYDVYFACSKKDGAPFLDEIMDEMWGVMLVAYVEITEEPPTGFATAYALPQQDMDKAQEYILRHAGPGFVDLFQRDVMLYLFEHQLAFFVRRYAHAEKKDSILHNGTIVRVW